MQMFADKYVLQLLF